MKDSPRREHLLDTAIDLFAKHGFNGTGIDTVLATAGVSKRTLYRHFRTKDELILAALKKYDGRFRNNFMRQIEARAGTPEERLLALFDVSGERFEENNFFGCIFVNAAGEFSNPETPIRRVCQEYKAMIRGYIEEQCVGLNIAEPAKLADELAMILEGAIVTAHVSQNGEQAAKTARNAACALIGLAQSDAA